MGGILGVTPTNKVMNESEILAIATLLCYIWHYWGGGGLDWETLYPKSAQPGNLFELIKMPSTTEGLWELMH